jgi:hypothetical protein
MPIRGPSVGTPRPLPVAGSGPSISGTEQVGEVLTCDPGQWTGWAITFTYQWIRDADTVIEGATDPTYTLVVGDQAHTVKCQVTGSTVSADFGTHVMTTAATGEIAAA